MQSPEAARRIAQSLVERRIAAGASAADALYVGERSSGVQVRLGELEDVSRSEGEQIGLRLFDGQRSATVASSDLSDDVAYRLAKALHNGHAALMKRLDQAKETTPQSTFMAAPSTQQIHPGVQRYLREIGVMK